jgi:DNA-binding SARP family transcriptional activator
VRSGPHPLRIELFGALRISRGSELITSVNTSRLQSLLAFLVLHGDAGQSREHLAFLLWPESSEAQARTNLRQLLHHLRRALPDEGHLLIADNHTVQWRRDSACAVDVLDFRAAVEQAEDASKRGDFAAEFTALEEAAHLYQEDLLRELYDDWIQPKREEYRRQAAQVLARLASIHQDRREYAAAISHAERLLTLDPLREAYHQLLIRLHVANSDRASALRVYHQCMRVLRRELGVQPGAATRELFEQALKSEATSAPVELPPQNSGQMIPLIGRRKEWERLIGCWEAVDAGGTLLTLIAGEPGIGKSRLAEELFQWCSGKNAAVARARCYAAQGQLAYGAVAEWLRAKPLREAVVRLSPQQLAELARVLPEILTENSNIPRPAPLTQNWERRYFYESLTAAFESARKPLLLVIDDVQWCDQDSLEWLPALFHSAEAAPRAGAGILIAATLRPEETDRSHPFTRLWSEVRRLGKGVELPLDALNSEETAALAAQISSRHMEAAESNELYRATKGNPLFVVESVRAGPAGLAAAPRVHAVIAARLSSLSSISYELAGLAGVIGRRFSIDLLAKATDWDEDSLVRALEELWQRRIIEADAAGNYDFTHDRLREVAYQELNPVRRRFLHRRVARALEEIHGPETESVAGEIAAHAEAGGMPEQAIRYYQAAAAVAGQRFADADAADLLRKALALCRGLPATARQQELELELLVPLARAVFTTSGYASPVVGEVCSRALSLFRRIKTTNCGLPVLSSMWVHHIVRGEIEASRQLGQELLELGSNGADSACLMAGNFILGSSCFHVGQFESAREHMEKALEVLPACDEAELQSFAVVEVGMFCSAYLPHVLWHLGYTEQAMQRSEQTLVEARKSHPFSLAISLNYAAMLNQFACDRRRALLYAQEGADLCERYGFAYYGSMANIVAGWAEGTEAGLTRARKGFDDLKATGAELRVPFYHALIAETCAKIGKTSDALANVASGLAFQSKNHEIWAAPYLHRVEGDLLMTIGNMDGARSSYERSVTLAAQLGARMLEQQARERLLARTPG